VVLRKQLWIERVELEEEQVDLQVGGGGVVVSGFSKQFIGRVQQAVHWCVFCWPCGVWRLRRSTWTCRHWAVVGLLLCE
jgi:hypothetical protein